MDPLAENGLRLNSETPRKYLPAAGTSAPESCESAEAASGRSSSNATPFPDRLNRQSCVSSRSPPTVVAEKLLGSLIRIR